MEKLCGRYLKNIWKIHEKICSRFMEDMLNKYGRFVIIYGRFKKDILILCEL